MLLAAVTVIAALSGEGPRVPGLALRFGETVGHVDSTHRWLAQAAGPGGGESRTARAPFFGIPATVKLYFESGRLARAEAAVDSATARHADYVQDELRRLGLRRRCAEDSPSQSRCTWDGRASVQLTIQKDHITATMEPPPREAEPASVVTAPPEIPGGGAAVHGAPPPTESAPTVVDSCVPRLPPAARRAGIQGRVYVSALIDTAGRVVDVRVQGGIPELNDAALACARRYRFLPARSKGRPEPAWTTIPVVFLLP